MKLYLYDEKHDQVIKELDHCKVTEELLPFLSCLANQLGVLRVFDRYQDLVVADSYSIRVDEDGESYVAFENRRL